MAAEEIADLPADSAQAIDVFVVRIQAAREVSRAIEQRFGVRHESPQVLLISGDRVVWHASHFRVTARSIAAAMRQHLFEPQPAT